MDRFTQKIHLIGKGHLCTMDARPLRQHKQRSRRLARRALKVEIPEEIDRDLDPTPEDLRVTCLELEPLIFNTLP